MTQLTLPSKLIQNILIICILMISTTEAIAVEELAAIASISFSRGSNAAVQAGKAPRLLGKGTDIYPGDNIQTSERSFVIIAFNDGAKITVRPNSSFSVTEYNTTAGKQHAELTLYKGGVRASSGEIARLDPEKYQIKTPLATIKAQQADYSVRICEKDCEQETNLHQDKIIKKTQNVIARIVDIKGTVTAETKKSQKPAPTKPIEPTRKQRHLVMGAPLYTADHLSSQKESYALLAFRDGGRMTVQAGSEFDISNYQYQQENSKDQAIYNLVKGGLRALTGRIGKVEKASYQINTPVATIGIRGTGFDLHCKGDCEDENASDRPTKNTATKIKQGQTEGLYSTVWQGSISQTNTRGRFELSKPNNNYIANEKTKPQALKQLPDTMRNNPAPRPDKVETNEEHLFGSAALQGTPSGVYVSVHNGHVQLIKDNQTNATTETQNKNDSLDLGKNEVGYIDTHGEIVRLDRQQSFQLEDNYPLPSDFNEDQADIGVYSLLADNYDMQEFTIYECVCD